MLGSPQQRQLSQSQTRRLNKVTLRSRTPSGETPINNIAFSDATLQAAGYTVLLYTNLQVEPSTPVWWSGPATYTQLSGTKSVNDTDGVVWNGTVRAPLCGEGPGFGGLAKVAFTPNTTGNMSNRLAVILSTVPGGGSVSVQVNTVKIGTNTSQINRVLTAANGNSMVRTLSLLIPPGAPIEIELSYPTNNTDWRGISLAFMNVNLPPNPSSLVATPVSDSQIDLSWTQSDSTAGAVIQRKLGVGGTYANVTAFSYASGAGPNHRARTFC